MNRFLTSLIATASVAAALQAQCFESNFGTQIGLGDDLAFPSATTATAFTMAGFPVGATTYTHFTVNTNGVVFPWTAATGVVGATTTGYSTVPATQLTNLRGLAGGAPRIAPLWRDLNLLAVNNGALWVNNSASKCVFTWANAVQFGTTGPIFTVQAQLFPSGDVQFYYNGTLASNAATITGISAGGAIAAVPGSDLSVGPNVATTNLIFEQFAANTIDLQGDGLSFINTGGTGYVQTAAPCGSSTTSYGAGCYNVPAAGPYEFHADAAVASADLQGNAMLLTPAGNGYTSAWVAGGATALYVAPTAGATSLTANDDGFNVVAVPGAGFPTASGLVTQFNVASNGVIAFGATNSNGGDFSPTGAEFAAAAVGNFYTWHDYNPAEAGSGLIKTELVGNTFHITWDAVENYSTPAGANPSTLQFSFDLSSGVVTMSWVTIDTNITSTFGSAYLVGWKGAGAVANAGSVDLAAGPQTSNPNFLLPLSLSGATTPLIGSTVTYTTSNIPEYVAGSGLYIGLHILSVNQVPAPGIDLFIIGAPGCAGLVGTLDLTTTLVGVGPGGSTQSNTFAIPATVPAGFQLFAQSIALVAPNSLPNGQNAFGLVSSNGLASTLDTF